MYVHTRTSPFFFLVVSKELGYKNFDIFFFLIVDKVGGKGNFPSHSLHSYFTCVCVCVSIAKFTVHVNICSSSISYDNNVISDAKRHEFTCILYIVHQEETITWM